MGTKTYDAIVVGAGPNGLTAAVVLARAGLSVLLLERNQELGGGCRTSELTLPGFLHDVCAAIHPIGAVSPVFRIIDLAAKGVEWVKATAPVAHPLEDGRVALLEHAIEKMTETLGAHDGEAWRALMAPYVAAGLGFFTEILRPIRIPRHPWLMARFGLAGLRSCESLVRSKFRDAAAGALFAGCAAHSFLPLNAAGSASFGLVLAIAGHALDWPCARGGSQQIIQALAAQFRSLRGEIQTGITVRELSKLPPARAILLDLTPRQVAAIAGSELPARYVRALQRFRYGPGVFKVDWALSEPIPWKNPACHLAATVHVGGTWEEIMASEYASNRGDVCERPFVLVAQQSLFDSSRAPAGRHTGWAYCHVPHGSTVDMTNRIEQQIERFAPGFHDTILARHVMNCADMEAHNANMIGGDIGGGSNELRQFLFRPVPRWNPYTTPNPRIFLCSSSTPPGGGVHGMCGYWCARSVLKRLRDLPVEGLS